MRRKLILGNWKMNHNTKMAIDFMNTLNDSIKQYKFSVDYGVAPSFLSIAAVQKLAKNDFIVVSQDAHYEANGAFTGNVSYQQLLDEKITWAIIGHSERRAMFSDDDARINKKVKALVNHKMTAVLCIGETLAEHEANQVETIVKNQLVKDLADVKANELQNVVIAYEPIWAIGTGKSATAQEAQATIKYIRSVVTSLYDQKIGDGMRILYGGSVKPANVNEILSQPDIDGALVGGASLKASDFAGLITANKEWYK